ncbi:MAG: hypothetical protein KDI19_02940 [Pseudomonadales bacterium]|nr:hypothetical protein [Pseudomonadales bacterium]
MSLEYRILADRHLVVARGEGIVTGTDVLNHLREIVRDAAYIAPMKKLVDYTRVSSLEISQSEAHQIAELKRQYAEVLRGERCAFIAPEDATYGTSRVHQALIDGAGLDTGVFRTSEEATRWLDIAPDPALLGEPITDSRAP